MARLILITHELTINGAMSMLFRLGEHLVAQGHSVAVLAERRAQGSLRSRFESAGLPIIYEIDPKAIDLAIGNTLYAAPVMRQLVGQTRTLWWVHEGEIGIKALVNGSGWHLLFRRCTHIVFQTAFQRDDIYRSFLYDLTSERISIIANCVRPAVRVPPVPRDKSRRILCVGTVYPRKRQADLIRAVASLGRDDLECVLVGPLVRALEPPIQAIVRSRPDVFRVLGEIDDHALHALYCGSDIFSLPSSSESQAMSVYEAGSYGLPPVLSDLRCYQGIWQHGHNCLLHPVGDVPVLAGMLNVLLRDADLRRRLGQAAAATVGSHEFRDATFTGRFTALIDRLLAAAP
jgi:glycosyltransferase involved in cell wall biosynthesis